MVIQWRSAPVTYRLQDSHDSVRKEVLCNILKEFIPTKLVRLIKMLMNVGLTSGNKIIKTMRLSGAYNKVRIGKYLSYRYPILESQRAI
jgi:hypothetical protein